MNRLNKAIFLFSYFLSPYGQLPRIHALAELFFAAKRKEVEHVQSGLLSRKKCRYS
jgi:hypothetical protein